MPHISPYIHFNGNAEEAFRFYQTVFGGEFTALARYREISGPEFPLSETDGQRITNIVLPIGKESALKGSDTLPMMGQVTETDNRNSISVSTDGRDEAERVFERLSAGGAVEMPLSDGPTGSYFGMCTDQFGVQWMVDHTPASGEPS